jgi:hypothetical protein
MRSAAAGHEIGYSSVLVPLVIMNVSAEDNNPGLQGLLLVLPIGGQCFFFRPDAVPTAKLLGVSRV